MNIELDPQDRERAEELSKATGKGLAQVLGELVHEALEQRAPNGDADEQEAVVRQQRELERLFQKLSPLPVAIDDGLSGRHHDEILFGRRS